MCRSMPPWAHLYFYSNEHCPNALRVSIGYETFNIPCIRIRTHLSTLSNLWFSKPFQVSLFVSSYGPAWSRFFSPFFSIYSFHIHPKMCCVVNQLSINCYRLSIRPISNSLQNINHNQNRMKSMTNTINWLNE